VLEKVKRGTPAVNRNFLRLVALPWAFHPSNLAFAEPVGTVGIGSFATEDSCHFLGILNWVFCYQVPLRDVEISLSIFTLHIITKKRLRAILEQKHFDGMFT
jgi:hypothetical protein